MKVWGDDVAMLQALSDRLQYNYTVNVSCCADAVLCCAAIAAKAMLCHKLLSCD